MEEFSWDPVEEDNIPEKLSNAYLIAWRNARNKLTTPPVTDERDVSAKLRQFLLSDQHRLGLDPVIKVYRRPPKPLPDLEPKANPRLPEYLQEIEKFNPELMNPTKTVINSSLPTLKDIELELSIDPSKTTERRLKRGIIARMSGTSTDVKRLRYSSHKPSSLST